VSEQDHDDFWGDDSGRRSSARRKPDGDKGSSGGGGGGGLSESQRKALPIVAAAAALLLIVVIFVVSRSSDSSTNKSTASSDSSQVASGGGDATTAPGGTTATGSTTTAKKPQAKWSNGLVGSPLVFRDPQGNASTDPQPGKTAKPGVYFWEAYDGWHVRIVKGDGVDKVDGLVTGVQNKQGAKIVKVTGADPGVAKVEGGNVSWQVPAGGNGIVGIDFTLDPSTKEAALTLNGENGSLDVKKVYIGSSTKNPPTNPITFVKKSAS
jgi:hypothetical protein